MSASKKMICFSFLYLVELSINAQSITTLAGIGNGNLPKIDSVKIDSIIVDKEANPLSNLYYPNALALAANGNVIITESFSNMVRVIKPNDVINVIGGTGNAGYSSDSIAAINAPLNLPSAVAIDDIGNIYIAEWNNNRIRRIDISGIITTIAGTGFGGYSGNGGLATAANINSPSGIAIDKQGNIYISEYANHVVRKIDHSGIITLVAGTPHVQNFSGDGGQANACTLNAPLGIAVDALGNLYIVDSGNDRIRKVDTQGTITTIAGSGVRGFSGDGAAATSAQIAMPQGVAVDVSGNVYITDMLNNRIRKVNTSGIISTIAGNGNRSVKGDNGPALAAEIAGPMGITVDGTGAIYFTDTFSHRIRVIK